MSGSVCPLPAQHTGADAYNMYKKKQKEMPGLTPAAWRKAAAQEMGIDYNTFLSLWKEGKGGVKKLASPGGPVVPTVAGPGADMDLTLGKVVPNSKIPTKKGLLDDLEKIGIKESKETKVVTTHTGKVYGGGTKQSTGVKVYKYSYSDTMELTYYDMSGTSSTEVWAKVEKIKKHLADSGYNVTSGMSKIKLNIHMPQSVIKKPVSSGLKKAAPKKLPPAPKPVTMSSEDLGAQIDDVVDGYSKGIFSKADVDDILGDLDLQASPGMKWKIDAAKQKIKSIGAGDTAVATEAAEAKMAVAQAAAEAAQETKQIMTSLGVHLDNSLAKDIYTQMKIKFPDKTAAYWRHAAADYLEVDYNDYLLAWKGAKAAKKTAKAVKGIPNVGGASYPSPPLAAGQKGKYLQADITPDQFKDELARLYGPGANKQFMTYDFDPVTGEYTFTMPQSIVVGPDSAATKGVVKGLEDLGLKVKQTLGPNTWKVKSPAHKKPPKPQPLGKNNQYNTTTLPNGQVVLDMSSVDSWTNRWWNTLTSAQRDSWKRYTGSGYHDINRYWRKGTSAGDTGIIRRHSKNLTETMQTLDKPITVYRGTSIDIGQFIEGKAWSDDGFMSTAINPGNAWQGVKFEISCPPGTKGMYIGNKSSHAGENEFLLNRGTRFRVLEVDKFKNLVRLVVIP